MDLKKFLEIGPDYPWTSMPALYVVQMPQIRELFRVGASGTKFIRNEDEDQRTST